MKREFVDPSTTTEADRALRLRKDLADAQAKLREAEQWREQAARAARLERELADAQAKLREAEQQINLLSKRPSRRQLQEAEEKLAAMEARLRERPAQAPRHVERCAQAKLNRRLFAENERLRQEARVNR